VFQSECGGDARRGVVPQKAFEALSRGGSLSVAQCYRLLDWLDKVGIGLWLGYYTLHKERSQFAVDAWRAPKLVLRAAAISDANSYESRADATHQRFRLDNRNDLQD
jgi:hypothetical protein